MKLSWILISSALGQIGSSGSVTGSIIPNDAQCQSLFQSQMQNNADSCPGVNVINPVGNKNACQSGCSGVLRSFVNSDIVGICAGSSVELNVIELIQYQMQQCALVITTRPAITTTVPPKPTTIPPVATTTGNATDTPQTTVTTTNGPQPQYPTMASASRSGSFLFLLIPFIL
ncbi:hypothetical protein HK103_002379 [Boothiomyces macroporosus]|uniref:Uncharacterized protein n=1 Tax=Boothiomyces macroporosus TaxID=261099 RepID=A0AAD5Y4T3_9FUNG|nr:hypothetical protein HK103_002379 [Boothiomyces macroporosus]